MGWVYSAPMHIYSSRGQCVILILYALRELGSQHSKKEVLRFIQDARLYQVIPDYDLPPYANKNEARYQTLLAWARKDAFETDWLVQTDERDAWQISRLGRAVLEKNLQRFLTGGDLDVRKCYLWTPKFKKLVHPSYEPSNEDAERPEEVLANIVV